MTDYREQPDKNKRASLIRERLNLLCVSLANAQDYTSQALAYSRAVAPGSLAVPALETVMEALEERLANVHIRRMLLDAYPHVGYYRLKEHEVKP